MSALLLLCVAFVFLHMKLHISSCLFLSLFLTFSLSFPHTQDHATRLNHGSTSGGGSFAAACSQLPPSSHTVPSERHWTPGRPIPSPGHLTNLYTQYV